MFENAQRLGVEALPSPRGQAQPGDLVGEGVLETEFRAARAAFLVQEVGGLEAMEARAQGLFIERRHGARRGRERWGPITAAV